ncbi:hypothetical protein CPB83DRAFT_911265 [Crepidotus variabilis]|uniref:F-box domain-containing protein n=1 Tax=Crepidotus variabilis TaxID=179855 RepID=A0A9P6E4Z7_9AGAR|nr:hypothetical protein CPB83DRAFT_911265 [Crepidotus variabilis]
MAPVTVPQPVFLHAPDRICNLQGESSCEFCTSLASLDAEIAATKSKLDGQLVARYRLLTQVNTKHDPMKYRLPVEITSQIFQHCLPDLSSPETFDSLSTRYSADNEFLRTTAKLTSINHNWRQIAHSTPELWNLISFHHYYDSLSQENLADLLTNVKWRIQQSGTLLLNIRLTIGDDPVMISYGVRIVKALFSQAHRWRSLRISAPLGVISAISTYPLPEGSPNLTCLTLHLNSSDPWWQRRTISFNTPNTRRLAPSYLSIRGVEFTTTNFDFSKLTDLNLGSCTTIIQVLHYLRLAPMLMSLTCLMDDEAQHSGLDFPLIHPHLKTLNLTDDSITPNILSRITLPSLETLTCRCVIITHSGDIYDFLSRSRCPLKTLSLAMPCSEEETINILQLTPKLCNLNIESKITPRFLQYLGDTTFPSEDQQTFLPHLQTLTFSPDLFEEPKFDWSFLGPLVPSNSATESRRRPLRKVILPTDGIDLAEGDKCSLLELILGGLDIHVYSETDRRKRNILTDDKLLADALKKLQDRPHPDSI